MELLRSLWQDVKFASRSFFRAPGFTVVVVLTLGLGIGANTAIFSVISSIVFRPLPVANPERFVQLYTMVEGGENYSQFSYPEYADYRDRSRGLSGLIGQTMIRVGLRSEQGLDGQAELIWGQLVTGNYFDVVGVGAATGRTFLPEEDITPSTHPVVVIGHRLWERRFARDPAVVGRTIWLNGSPFTVVGVADEGFVGTKFALAMDLWVPVMMRDQVMSGGDWLNERGSVWLDVYGRMKDGVSLEQTQAEILSVAHQLQEEYPLENEDELVHAYPEWQARGGHPEVGAARMRTTTFFVLGLVSLVLLVACANVVNLLLARANARQTEVGMRIALGAGKRRILRQLLTENLILGLLGGGFGILLAYWGTALLERLFPRLTWDIALDFRPDGQALTYALVVSLLTGLVLGLAPATYALKTDLVSVLKGEASFGARRSRRFQLRDLLVGGQVAISLVLLVTTGLFVRSLTSAQKADPGFEVEGGVLSSLDLEMLRYSEERGRVFFRQLKEQVEALPAVESASFARVFPLGGDNRSVRLYPQGADTTDRKQALGADWNAVGEDYFSTMGIPLIRGRGFEVTDVEDTPKVVVVNESLAERLWPDQDPIGQRLTFAGVGQDLREVVGVAKDGKYRQLAENPLMFVYVPTAQSYSSAQTLVVRAEGDPTQLITTLRREVSALAPGLPVYNVKTFKDNLEIALWPITVAATMMTVTGLLALVLALVGIYGIMAFTVGQRTREIGLRMALGASHGKLLGLMVRKGLSLALIGAAIGLVLAAGLSVIFSKVLYGVQPVDPLVFGLTVGLFVAATMLASFLPARRASRVNPMSVLRIS